MAIPPDTTGSRERRYTGVMASPAMRRILRRMDERGILPMTARESRLRA